MGIGGIGPGSLLIILLIVVLLFGTKKLRNVGGDLGSALKSFRSAVREGDDNKGNEQEQLEGTADEGEEHESGRVIDAESEEQPAKAKQKDRA